MRSEPTPATRKPADEAAERILDRRTAHRPEDVGLQRFPGTDNLLGTVEYVAMYRQVSDDTRRQDVADVLTILTCLRSYLPSLEAAAIDAGRDLGMEWSEIGEALGGLSKQGAEQRRVRLGAPVLLVPRAEPAVRAAIRQRARATADAADLTDLIRRTATALAAAAAERPPRLARECWDELGNVLYYFTDDAPKVAGPGLIPVTRDLLDCLAEQDIPQECVELLCELSERLPDRQPRSVST